MPNAHGRFVPTPAKALHLPDVCPGDHLAGNLLGQAELEEVNRASDTLLPKSGGAFPRYRLGLIAFAQCSKPAIYGAWQAIETTLEDEDILCGLIAPAREERFSAQVAGQKARQLATAIQAKVEGIERGMLTGRQRGRAALGQIRLAATQQLRADSAAPVRGADG